MKKRNVYTDSKGNRLPGVTTVLSCLAKDALVPWASKMACDVIRSAWTHDTAFDKEYIERTLENAKNAHRIRKMEAGDIGTRIHELCGAYIDGQLPRERWSTMEAVERNALKNFARVTEGWEWLGSEIVVIHENCKYGGTADAIARLPSGMVVIMDVKTSTSCHASFDLQLAMYAAAAPCDEKYRAAWGGIKEGRILHFHKDIGSWEVLERDVEGQKPYIPHVCAMYDWRRKFDARW
ncbi:MAG: RecB family exonuclease [Siphoviridae sp. ctpQM7]|nr:MAG: RecB family exonuclease [Siphoviridae sp. ctpQM7]